ncbi:P-loop containing nucleoside triphosphate hydrolase protein [Polychytrium aggregatum]|uniref:P-loop containing nucleoside triphosphate hydrolase protein n=1 Tax=Polychytrium aggregatum TaxID=110093 RepID=UPI0022FEBEAD|nr:P-loop containing nucleoside triphosphate hydrolase protein [Polychytrium aggregatum]KAI9202858.1 P-loop containing nucleoside triphosphate hydrolase protein [Polychytrium aggregatum]
MTVPAIVIKHLRKEYHLPDGEVITALNDIHLSDDSDFDPIGQGEFVMLRGPSGGGKTSLLNILGTIDTLTQGNIEILGHQIDNRCTDRFLSNLRLRQIGFVFQTFNLLSTMTALENVELPMAIANELDERQRRERALELLAMVGLRDRVNHLPSELSGGEQQRVTIARALSNRPQILLMDEPTGDLDSSNTIDVMDLILRINQQDKVTIVMVTHNPDVECYANRLLYLEDGVIVKQAVNKIQVPLILQDYQRYLSSKDQ